MLISQEMGDAPSKESQAFSATLAMFKISIADIARLSGVQKGEIERFKSGSTHITSRTVAKILGALTVGQRAFYSSMVILQWATDDANIKMPILNFPILNGTADVFREAYRMTMEVFGVQHLHVAKASGIADSNLNAWYRGNSDCELRTLDKIKGALSPQQRAFMQAISDVLFLLSNDDETK